MNIKMYTYYFLIFLQFCGISLFSQDSIYSIYSAQVVNEENMPIPAVSIELLESGEHVLTDEMGNFRINTDRLDFTLELSSLGYETRQIHVVNGNFPREIDMTRVAVGLKEIVVTALGLEREKQSLGSSLSTVAAEKLSMVPMTNLINSLAGNVPGVQITNGSSGVGSSSRIIIRGENSLSGSNQPLFVVEGVPIRNRQIGSLLINDGSLAEVDFGNGAADINPGDIESITILKGIGAAALYGSRAANGVVLIDMKDGGKNTGLGISIHSTFTLSTPLTMPQYQNIYGGGSNGMYSFLDGKGGGVFDGGIASFGPRLDRNLLIKQFDSPSVDVHGNPVRAGDVIARTRADGTLTAITPTPWIARPDNIRDFFGTGFSSQNNISLNGGDENTAFRISYGNLRHKGMLPNTDYNRDGIMVNLHHELSEKLKVNFFADYVNSRSKNRPNLGYGYENVMYGFNWTGRQTDLESLRNYWQVGQSGLQQFNLNYKWINNPYFTLYENTNSFKKNRIFGNLVLKYLMNEHLEIRLKSGADIFNENRTFKRAFSTISQPYGGYREDEIAYKQMNTDFLISYTNSLFKQLNYAFSLGAHRLDEQFKYKYVLADELVQPGNYTFANSGVPLRGLNNLYRKRINSVYGIGNFNYRKKIYVSLNFRNDWSSTLPLDDNSYAYYSASMSLVFSRFLDLPSWFPYGKLRISTASVGNDTDPYQLENTFRHMQAYADYFRVSNGNILKNAHLKPERLNAYEIGTELWFLDSRIQADISAYRSTSINQIIGRPISRSSGFSNVIVNGGAVRTQGLEVSVKARVIEKQKFSWLTALNYSTYRSKVTHLPEGVSQYVTGQAKIFDGGGGSNVVFYIAKEGGRVGDMYGTGFVKIDGEILYGANGLPIQDNSLRLLGNYNPDFTVGFYNEFRVKDFSFRFLWDWRQGGTIVSRQKALGSTSGVLIGTLKGRETGIVGDGVMNIGTTENPEYVTNTTRVSGSRFYNNFYDRGNEESAVYDGSYLKLRQVSLYYTFPQSMMKRIGLNTLQLGLVGSNLFLFTENPHFDPELNMLEGPVQTFGVEDFSYPSARSYGISLKTQI